MPNQFGTATALVLVLVLTGVAVSPHAQTPGLAYRLTVTIDGVEESCREPSGPEFYVTVTRRDLELQDQIAAADREAAQIARLADPGIESRQPDLQTLRYGTTNAVRESLSARDLNSKLDPLSETERRLLERLRGVPSSDRTDDERRELEALASREPLSSAESRMLQRMDELAIRSRDLSRQLRMRTSPGAPNSMRVYLNDELQVVLMESDVFNDDTCLSSDVVLDRSVLERQYLEIAQDDRVLLTLRFAPVEE